MKRTKALTPVPWQRTPPSAKVDPISPEVRRLVHTRSGKLCELCGGPGQHLHHRQLRRGGDHSAANLVNVCHADHTRIHGHTAWAYETGWLVSQYADPARTPLLLNDEWVLLDRDGLITPAPPVRN